MSLGAVAVLSAGALASAAVLFAMGTNDVGAVAATGPMRSAVAVAAALEFAGAFLRADEVAGSVATGVAPTLLGAGATGLDVGVALSLVCAMLSSAIVVGVGTALSMPIATLHAVVGALVGVGFLHSGFGGVSWTTVNRVAASWLLSPVLGGVFAVVGRYALKLCGVSHARYKTAVPVVSGVTAVATLNLVALSAPPWLIHGWYSSWYTAAGVNAVILVSVTSMIAGYMRRNTGASIASVAVYNVTEEEDVYADEYADDEHADDEHSDETVGDGLMREKPGIAVGPSEVFVIDANLLSGAADDAEMDDDDDENWGSTSFVVDERAPVFRVLLAGTTAAIAFAHGSTDVALGTAPFAGILRAMRAGASSTLSNAGGVAEDAGRQETPDLSATELPASTASTPADADSSATSLAANVGGHDLNLVWCLGAAATIVAGLLVFGYGIGVTIGDVNKRSKTSHARSFSVNLAVVLSMLCCKWLDLPLSTSYCIVSSSAVSSVAYVSHTQRALERVHEGLDVPLLTKMVVAAAAAPLASCGLAVGSRLAAGLVFQT